MKTVCIVGCGQIAKAHAKRLQNKVHLAFCSRNVEKANIYQRKYHGIGCFSSYEDVLADASIDAVVLCTPPELHQQQIIQAFEFNKSVLVEKPMVVSMEELEAVQKHVEKYPHLFLMVAENYYYKPCLTKLIEMLSSEARGEIQKIHIRKMFTQKSSGWKMAYGSLFEGGIHFVAFLSRLMGTPSSIVADFPALEDQNQPERTSHLTLHYDNGSVAQLDYSWETPDCFYGAFQQSTIITRKEKITFESNGLFIKTPNKLFVPSLKDLSGRTAMMDDFLKCLYKPSHKPDYGFSEAYRDLNIVFQAYASQNIKVKV